MDVTTGRLRAALRRSADWQAAATIDELAQQACETLLELIPADGAGWNEIARRSGATRVIARPSDYMPDQRRLTELIHENPLAVELPRTHGRACAISDFISVRAFHRRRIYNDVYRPYDVEDQLGAAVAIDDERMVAVALNRPRRSFTASDRELLDLLREHLAAAYATVLDRADARVRLDALERGVGTAGLAVAALAADGTVADASAHARRLLAAWFGGEIPRPGRYHRDGAVLTVRRSEGTPPLLLLDEQRRAPDLSELRELGLTRRESEVAALVARGLRNREIADALFLSPRTVQKHLEHVFAKVGVSNRTELTRRLLDGK
jgi:DNA-binding NarL/FixJ family response regulator